MPIPEQEINFTRVTVKQKIYKTIQEWIIQGKLLPGERVSDTEIAKLFNVSRTPVREALQMLEEENLLKVIPSSGTFVSEINMDDMKHIYFLIGKLQGIAVEEFIGKIDGKEISRLKEINEEFLFYSSRGKAVETISADRDFHRYISELSGNPYVIEFTDQLLIHCLRNEFHFFSKKSISDESYNMHCKIIEAISENKMEDAKILLEENWMNSLRKI